MDGIIILMLFFTAVLLGYIIGHGCGFIAGKEYINEQIKELNDLIEKELFK